MDLLRLLLHPSRKDPKNRLRTVDCEPQGCSHVSGAHNDPRRTIFTSPSAFEQELLKRERKGKDPERS